MKKFFYLVILFFIVSCTATKKNVSNPPKQTMVKIETEFGDIVLKLYNQTPVHRDNFIKLVKQHFYDSLLFHRVISGFMIQGGDPDSKHAKPGAQLGDGGLKYTLAPEFDTSLFHKKGALAAAREGDDMNPKKRSSSTQFYIVQGKTFNDEQMNKMEEHFNIKIPENHRQVYRTVGGAPFLDMNYTVFGEVESGFDVIDKIANAPKDANDRPLQNIRMKITLLK